MDSVSELPHVDNTIIIHLLETNGIGMSMVDPFNQPREDDLNQLTRADVNDGGTENDEKKSIQPM